MIKLKDILNEGSDKEFERLKKKVIKLVNEVNALIKSAIDSDGDPLEVIDRTSTWEEPLTYMPIIFNEKTGRLTIKYKSWYSRKKGVQKEVILKRNLEWDGLPFLRDIRKHSLGL